MICRAEEVTVSVLIITLGYISDREAMLIF